MPERTYFDPFRTQRILIADQRLSSNELLVALVILANRISKTGDCKLKNADLMAGTRLSKSSVQRCVSGLVEKSVLKVERTGRKSQFIFVCDEAEIEDCDVEEGVSERHIRGVTQTPQKDGLVSHRHLRGVTETPLSFKEEPELPDPETLPDSEMQSAASWEDLQEADALMQAEEASSPTRHLQKKCPYVALKDLYHAVLPELEPVRIDTERRKRDVQELWREVVKRQECKSVADGLLQFRRYFEKVRRSRIFDQAVKSTLPWQVDFSWLMTSKTFVKFVEGGYD